MPRLYRFNEPDEDGNNHVVTISEASILERYWDYWSNAMRNARKDPSLITEQNCIEDWCVVNYAWEIT